MKKDYKNSPEILEQTIQKLAKLFGSENLIKPELHARILKQTASDYFKKVDKENLSGKAIPYSHSGLAKFIGIEYNGWVTTQSNLQAYPVFIKVLYYINLKIHANQIEGALLNIYPEDILNETYWKWHEARE